MERLGQTETFKKLSCELEGYWTGLVNRFFMDSYSVTVSFMIHTTSVFV